MHYQFLGLTPIPDLQVPSKSRLFMWTTSALSRRMYVRSRHYPGGTTWCFQLSRTKQGYQCDLPFSLNKSTLTTYFRFSSTRRVIELNALTRLTFPGKPSCHDVVLITHPPSHRLCPTSGSLSESRKVHRLHVQQQGEREGHGQVKVKDRVM